MNKLSRMTLEEKREYWRIQSKKYYIRNKEKKLAAVKKYHTVNHEKILAYIQKWQKTNPDKLRSYLRKYSKKQYAKTKKLKQILIQFDIK